MSTDHVTIFECDCCKATELALKKSRLNPKQLERLGVWSTDHVSVTLPLNWGEYKDRTEEGNESSAVNDHTKHLCDKCVPEFRRWLDRKEGKARLDWIYD